MTLIICRKQGCVYGKAGATGYTQRLKSQDLKGFQGSATGIDARAF